MYTYKASHDNYFITQRVLRYPLFLKAMKDLTPQNSDEQGHLIGMCKNHMFTI